jgi:competence protein ComEC
VAERGARTRTWDAAATRGRGALPWRFAETRPGAEVIKRWLTAEVAAGRLVPWLPVAFGLGIVLYFTAEREPAWWAALALLLVCLAAAGAVRQRAVAFPVLLGLTAAAAGFALTTGRTALIAHPVLRSPAFNVSLAGFIENREERERTDRIVVRTHRIEGARLDEKPERVRLSVRKGTAPPVGSFVELRARLSPPLAPLRPGGYDFARDLFFQKIGASGFALGAIRIAEPPVQPGLWLRYAAVMQGMRDAIDTRIRAVLLGDKGSIASALITGKRDAISAHVNDAMYVSGIGHVLSISGYHMVVVFGVVFFALRASLALSPALASRFPIKKWAALAALGAVTFYLLLSGAEVATQRAFIMIAIVLVGVMLDRPALTLRTLTVAALAVLVLAPEAVVHPSFQMSFAATLALVAGYERGQPWRHAGGDTRLGARIALWGGGKIAGLAFASLLAGLATTLYAAYHFHRLAPYGVLANLLAMPVVSAWVMPAGILGLFALPFGFDGLFWRLMGGGIDWMIAVALWVAGLPGAVGRIAAFGTGPLLLGTAGLLFICLLKTPLRWCGAVLALVASVWAMRTPQPDILVAADGQTFAVRAAAGRLAAIRTGSDSFALRDWLSADGDPRSGREPDMRDGLRCDDAGCAGRLADGAAVAIALSAEAFAEDCRRAAAVVSPRAAPPDCAATWVDRPTWRQYGAVALRWVGQGFETRVSRPRGYDRPWARPPPGEGAQRATPASRAPQPDATPPTDELQAGD